MSRTHGERMKLEILSGGSAAVYNVHKYAIKETRRTFPNNISGTVTANDAHIRGSRLNQEITFDYYEDASALTKLVDADVTFTLMPDTSGAPTGTGTGSLTSIDRSADKEGGEAGGSGTLVVNGAGIVWVP